MEERVARSWRKQRRHIERRSGLAEFALTRAKGGREAALLALLLISSSADPRDPPSRRAHRSRERAERAVTGWTRNGESPIEEGRPLRPRAVQPSPAREGNRADHRRPARRDRTRLPSGDGWRDRRPNLRRDADAR